MFKILVAEDDKNIRLLLTKNLQNAGYYVIDVEDGKSALFYFTKDHIDLVITDIMMPKMDGNELTAEIRKLRSDIPILMLTALESIDDKSKGFDSGTDDYMVKPIIIKELLMRVKALLRRYASETEQTIRLKNTTLFHDSNTMEINGQQLELTKKQFLLLFKLLSNPSKIFTREQLLNEIWGFDNFVDDRTVDTHISWLRDKTNCDDFEIVTVRGIGYKAVLK
jgi:DNA-binding response OmpR family regulator